MLKIRSLNLPTISIRQIWWMLPLAISFIAMNLTPLKEGDLWWHIKVGEQAVRSGQVPRLDEFTFTAFQQPYLFSHSWFSEVALFIIERVGGLSSLVLLQAVVSTIIVALLLRASAQRGAPATLAAILTIIGWVGLYPYSSTRPQIFSFLFLAIYAALCSDYALRGKNRLWLLPVVMVLWINFHGAWITGIMLWAITLGGAVLQRWWNASESVSPRPLLVWGIVSILVLPLNPEGFAIYRSLLSAGSNPINQQFVSEWQPLVITNMLSWAFFGLLALWIVGLAFTAKRPRLYEIALMLVFAAFALRYLRMPPFFYIVSVPIIAETLAGIEWQRLQARFAKILAAGGGNPQRSGTINLIFLLALISGTITSLPPLRLAFLGQPESSLISKNFPVQAVADLTLPSERIFSLPEWGGYLIWSQYPPAQVFVDGRVELFPTQIWDDYLHIAGVGENWQELLDQYGVDTLVLSRERQGALIEAASQNGWVIVAEDKVAVILMRRGAGVSTSSTRGASLVELVETALVEPVETALVEPVETGFWALTANEVRRSTNVVNKGKAS
jgi:hypothetical protein